jgi:hypothetical protein
VVEEFANCIFLKIEVGIDNVQALFNYAIILAQSA